MIKHIKNTLLLTILIAMSLSCKSRSVVATTPTPEPPSGPVMLESPLTIASLSNGTIFFSCNENLYKSIIDKIILAAFRDTVNMDRVYIDTNSKTPILRGTGKEVNSGFPYYYARELTRVGNSFQVVRGSNNNTCKPESCTQCTFSKDNDGKIIGCLTYPPTTECPSSYCGHSVSKLVEGWTLKIRVDNKLLATGLWKSLMAPKC